MKDELNFFHYGGGGVYLLQSELSYSTMQYAKSIKYSILELKNFMGTISYGDELTSTCPTRLLS